MAKGSGNSPFSAGEVIAQKYKLTSQLGEGAMGVVWKAVNEMTGGEVALKLIVRPETELRVRLLREARACCAIRHRNVIQIHDVGTTDDGDPFLVMELLSGETLADMLVRKRRLSQEEAATIARDIARALAAAHEKEIVHRDLKPANIYLHHEPGGDGHIVKVLDFGVSKNLVATDGMRTVAGGAVGSPMYMSPEQASSDPTTDGRADIWSLGVVLFEMLTGQKPFTGETLEVIQKVLAGEIPTISRKVRKVDPAIDQLVSACLQRRREDRPWPASELVRQLDPFAAPGPRGPMLSLSDSWTAADTDAVPPARPSQPNRGSTSSTPGQMQRAETAPSGRAESSDHARVLFEEPRYSGASQRASSPGYGSTVLMPNGSATPSVPRANVDDEVDDATRPIQASKMANLVHKPFVPRQGTVPILTNANGALNVSDDLDTKATVPIEASRYRGARDAAGNAISRDTLKLEPVDSNSNNARLRGTDPVLSTVPFVMPGARRESGASDDVGKSNQKRRKTLLFAIPAVLAVALTVTLVVALSGTPGTSGSGSEGEPHPAGSVANNSTKSVDPSTVPPTASTPVGQTTSAPMTVTATTSAPEPVAPQPTVSASTTTSTTPTSPTKTLTNKPAKPPAKACDCSSKFKRPACCDPYNPQGL